MDNFTINGLTYRPVFNELGEIGGCCQLNGKDFQECRDCKFEGNCPGEDEE